MTMFGTAVVFLLLASKNIQNFLKAFFHIDLHFCILILIVAFCLLPITFLKSPKDFWPAVIGAMITTTIAVILICTGTLKDYDTCHHEAHYPPMQANRVFMTFGTVMFAYGGHGAFPTIQHDMKKPYQFKFSVCLAFIIIGMMYMPVSVLGYITYGDSLQDSIIPSLQIIWMQQSVNILITLHVVLALTIIFNPLNQELEDMFNVPHHFGYQRVLTRSAMMAATVFVAETVPHFGVLLDLVGGSTITLMALVFPGIFNLYLSAAKQKVHEKRETDDRATIYEILTETPKLKLIANLIVLAVGVIGGIAATYSAMNAMAGAEFSLPCYVRPFVDDYDTKTVANANHLPLTGHTNCCGMFKNITRYGDYDTYCVRPGVVNQFGGHH
jgi:vesicular inhibitory amino acid transporter